MLKPPHPAAVAGYVAAMLINPNNHALDGGLATSRMEKEAVAQLAAMFGLGQHLGHLTSSGTIANLEALYIARELHPGLGVAYSSRRTTRTAGCAGCSGCLAMSCLRTAPGGWTWPRWTRCWPGAGRHRGGHDGHYRSRRDRPGARSCRWRGGTGSGCTWTPPTAGSSPCSPGARTGPGWTRHHGGPSPPATRSWWTRTSTGCSPTAAGRCCSLTRRSAGSTGTLALYLLHVRRAAPGRDTAWNAHGPGPRGGRAVAHLPAAAAAGGRARRPWRGARGRAAGRAGLVGAPGRVGIGSTCTSRPTWTSCAISR